jgi:acyl-CoA synthetase (AMP-forming)/AMP-acid ligase II
VTASTWNDLVRAHWLGSPEPAVVTAEGDWSGDELLRRAGGAAEWLEASGFTAGMAVPAFVDESPTAIALAVGASLSGRALAPLGTRLPPAELAFAVKGLDTTGLVTTADLAPLAKQAADLAGVELHILDGPPGYGPIPEVECHHDDVLVIVHTSGTTGAPKPVFMRHRQMVARIQIYTDTMPIGPGDRYCSASPFYHTAGVTMTFTVLGMGAAQIPQAWFSVEGWRQAGRLGVTGALLVPTMIDMLLSEGALADAHPTILQYGAAPIDPATLRAALDALPDTRFLQIFGQTEVSPVTALTHADHVRALNGHPELLSTVGRAAPGVELQVEHAGDDGIGEIALRSPHCFVVDDDGWHRTGDLGSIDNDGYVRLQGRLNDRIVRGGENIYPIEVEQALASHPDVHEVAVVGVPDRRWGEVVKAVVVPRHVGAPPSTQVLQAHARERLAHFKIPAIIEFADQLPRNPSGKVLRRKLIG